MLVKCKECGHEVSDKALSCPYCGCPISTESTVSIPVVRETNITNSAEESKTYFCPYCLSSNVSFDKQGFGVGKAVVGVVITGGIGALAGTIGMNKIKGRCVECNKSFTASEAVNATAAKVDEVKSYVRSNYGKLPDDKLMKYMRLALPNIKYIDVFYSWKSKGFLKKVGDGKNNVAVTVVIAIIFIILVVCLIKCIS